MQDIDVYLQQEAVCAACGAVMLKGSAAIWDRSPDGNTTGVYHLGCQRGLKPPVTDLEAALRLERVSKMEIPRDLSVKITSLFGKMWFGGSTQLTISFGGTSDPKFAFYVWEKNPAVSRGAGLIVPSYPSPMEAWEALVKDASAFQWTKGDPKGLSKGIEKSLDGYLKLLLQYLAPTMPVTRIAFSNDSENMNTNYSVYLCGNTKLDSIRHGFTLWEAAKNFREGLGEGVGDTQNYPGLADKLREKVEQLNQDKRAREEKIRKERVRIREEREHQEREKREHLRKETVAALKAQIFKERLREIRYTAERLQKEAAHKAMLENRENVSRFLRYDVQPGDLWRLGGNCYHITRTAPIPRGLYYLFQQKECYIPLSGYELEDLRKHIVIVPDALRRVHCLLTHLILWGEGRRPFIPNYLKFDVGDYTVGVVRKGCCEPLEGCAPTRRKSFFQQIVEG